MNFIRAAIASGQQSVAGFKQDDQFLGVEGIGNHLAFTWIYSDGQTNKFRLNWAEAFSLELVSINGGNNNQLATWETYINVPNQNNLLIFSSDFSNPRMPFTFPQGCLIPPASSSVIITNSSTNYLQIICKPSAPIALNTLSPFT